MRHLDRAGALARPLKAAAEVAVRSAEDLSAEQEQIPDDVEGRRQRVLVVLVLADQRDAIELPKLGRVFFDAFVGGTHLRDEQVDQHHRR